MALVTLTEKDHEAIQCCLGCQEPPERCDNNGLARPCPHNQQFGRLYRPPVLIQHTAGVTERAEVYDHMAIKKQANKVLRSMQR